MCSITPQTQRVNRNHLRFLSRDAPVTVEKKGQISISDCDFDDDSQPTLVSAQFFDDEDPIQFVKKGIDSDEYWYGEGDDSHENTLNILITPRTAEHGGYSITG